MPETIGSRNDASNNLAETIDLQEVVRFLWKSKWPMLFGGLAGLLIGLAISIWTLPVYRAEVLLSPVESSVGSVLRNALTNQVPGLAALAGIGAPTTSGRAEGVALLTSRSVTQQFVTEENLLPVLLKSQWDASNRKWKPSSLTDEERMDQAVELFRNRVCDIATNRTTGLVTLAIEWTDPRQAADWANKLVQLVNQTSKGRATREAELSIEYLNKELLNTNVVEIRQSVYSMIEAQLNNKMMANIREDYALRVIDPAVAPSAGRFVRPRKLVLLAGFLVGGVMFGLLFSIGRRVFR